MATSSAVNPATSATAADPRLQLEEQLEEFVETLRQVGIVATSFQSESQPVLNAKLGSLVSQMQALDELRQAVDIDIPLDLLRYVDDDMNPQVFTNDVVLEAVQKNRTASATVDMFQKFKTLLESELATTMPEDFALYQQQISAASALPSPSQTADALNGSNNNGNNVVSIGAQMEVDPPATQDNAFL
ncbi:hypothetical protein CAOG_01862 [Capsaspora owczarzaki ATCC 30864]|uniref:Mediator of RNA polymerase II transcription subunit 10 n=1 Tax=Capsaspora owczarzaki (strain ATCC 30864) TaxID=595528 RepID=A0A0D2VKL2_CAPO3|nr:hypothetical protein CAOG_01862 [Capsaspora owczarzaki ATCC 30864]KJE90562.1 hypothetical protein CAOG_001862 [Capsaspora owczarzaki ATCC 30864]|eukprot:XP_004364730.1 hypothetical protein CAOG_01862 [Capsaspora owczarzaki ATCC 30864]